MSAEILECEDTSDLMPLCESLGLYLKPVARVNISIHYPTLKQSLTNSTATTKTVSSWDLIEKIRALASPEKFLCLKTTKSSMEFVRFQGDLENRVHLKNVISRLEGRSLKVTGFKEPLKILTAEAKSTFPSKYDWDSFFRDAKNMNEMKAGERPDTIHFKNLPSKWFSKNPEDSQPKPSEEIFKRVLQTYGEVRYVDIPSNDPYRTRMKPNIAGIQTFTFSNHNVFEAYVQYKDYLSFVKAMDALRGNSLFYETKVKSYVAFIKVDFDKTKHLSEDSVKRRYAERQLLINSENKVSDSIKRKTDMDGDKGNSKREKSNIQSDNLGNNNELQDKIQKEQLKYMTARRKLEAIRLVDYLFESLKKNKLRKDKKLLEEKEKARLATNPKSKSKSKKVKVKVKSSKPKPKKDNDDEYNDAERAFIEEEEENKRDAKERKSHINTQAVRSSVPLQIKIVPPAEPDLPPEFQFSTRYHPPPHLSRIPRQPRQEYPSTPHPSAVQVGGPGGPYYNKNYINDWELPRNERRVTLERGYLPQRRYNNFDNRPPRHHHNNNNYNFQPNPSNHYDDDDQHYNNDRHYSLESSKHVYDSRAEEALEMERAYEKYFKSIQRKSQVNKKKTEAEAEEPPLEESNHHSSSNSNET